MAPEVQTQSICRTCQTVPFDKLPEEKAHALLHSTWEKLKVTAGDCQLCRVILWATKQNIEQIKRELRRVEAPKFRWNGELIEGAVPDLDEHPTTKVWLFGSWSNLAAGWPTNRLMGFGVRLGTGHENGLLPGEANGSKPTITFIGGTSVRICADFNSPMGDLVPGRVRSWDCGSEETYLWAERVKTVCEHYHRCKPQSAQLPPRVLRCNVSEDTTPDSDFISLLETDREPGKYVALSHCWGTSRHLVTTTDNIWSHKEKIAVKDLPKTFRDAVTATRRLGYRYLWIDSLCIIQDSEEDWILQSSLMDSIYTDADLTIAATGSTGDEAGCFTPRKPIYHSPDAHYSYRDTRPEALVSVTVTLSTGEKCPLYFFPEWQAATSTYRVNTTYDPMRLDPLSRRAWALQERVLSRRVLHYGADQMFWECREAFFGEDGARLDSVTRRVALDLKGRRDPVIYARNLWTKLVKMYSRLRLTRLSDKLPALAGLSAQLGALTGDEFYAGLWKRDIWAQLFWRVMIEEEWSIVGSSRFKEDHATEVKRLEKEEAATPPEEKGHPWIRNLEVWRQMVKPDCAPLPQDVEIPSQLKMGFTYEEGGEWKDVVRPEVYQAPSWTFAAINKPVSHRPLDGDVIAEMVDIHVETTGLDRYGRVKSGWIILKGPLIELVEPTSGSKTLIWGTRVFTKPQGEGKDPYDKTVFFDYEPVFPCWVLCITCRQGIVLRPRGDAGESASRAEWERVGLMDDYLDISETFGIGGNSAQEIKIL